MTTAKGSSTRPRTSGMPEAGKPGRRCPRTVHGAWAPGPAEPVAGRGAQEAGRVPPGRADPDPARPDDRVPVLVLPGRRRSHGRRPLASPPTPGCGSSAAATRTFELRRVRGTGPDDGLRHQRLRRDARRAVGVGRQAPRRELRDRSPRPVASTRRPVTGSSRARPACTASRCASTRARATSRSGTAASTSTTRSRSGPIGSAEAMKRFQKSVAKARSKDSMRAFTKLTTRSTADCASRATRR